MPYKSHISDPDCSPSWPGLLFAIVDALLGYGVYRVTGIEEAGVLTFFIVPFVCILGLKLLRIA
jgi:hypothetical protein